MAAGELVRRQLQGRLDADDDEVGVLRPELLDGRRGGSVAGHHQSLHGVLGGQLVSRRQGQRLDLRSGPGAIGGVGGVAEIDIPLLGHELTKLPQNTDAADAGIKYRNIIIFGVHIFTNYLL